MLADVAQGRTKNGDAARTALKSSLSWVDGKIDQFKKKPAPKFSEVTAYRKVFLGYLAWEREFFVRWTAETLKVLEDPKLAATRRSASSSTRPTRRQPPKRCSLPRSTRRWPRSTPPSAGSEGARPAGAGGSEAAGVPAAARR
jgi:hypothetical protein